VFQHNKVEPRGSTKTSRWKGLVLVLVLVEVISAFVKRLHGPTLGVLHGAGARSDESRFRYKLLAPNINPSWTSPNTTRTNEGLTITIDYRAPIVRREPPW